MNKFDELYEKILQRAHSHCSPNLIVNYDKKETLSDIILESVMPSPLFLINDIFKRISTIDEFSYTYSLNELIKLSSKSWKFFENLIKLPSNCELTIIKCDYENIQKYISFNINLQGNACEFYDGKNWKHEYIWIDTSFKSTQNDMKIMLQHELGHVWTSFFGFNEDNFCYGRTNFTDHKLKNMKFSKLQHEVFSVFYNKNYELLEKDFEYIFNENGNSENWEFSVHIDEIIELLINDHFEAYSNLTTTQYLNMLFSYLKNENFNLNLITHYKSSIPYEKDDNIVLMKNIIRRLFLIFAFASDEALNFFYEECKKEFN